MQEGARRSRSEAKVGGTNDRYGKTPSAPASVNTTRIAAADVQGQFQTKERPVGSGGGRTSSKVAEDKEDDEEAIVVSTEFADK